MNSDTLILDCDITFHKKPMFHILHWNIISLSFIYRLKKRGHADWNRGICVVITIYIQAHVALLPPPPLSVGLGRQLPNVIDTTFIPI